MPLTADSPLFPGTPTKSEELDVLITPLAPASAANQLMHDRLQLGGFSPEQHHRHVWTRERKRCCMIRCCLVSVVGTFFLVGYYTGLFK